MRLPEDVDEAVAVIRQAIDAGMIYIDTSRGYGDSEIKIGKSLKDGYREKVILSTKWSPWITKIEENDDASADCTYKRICESMERLDVDYLDFYQVWNIFEPDHYQQTVAKGGMLEGIRRAMDEGIVKHTGFTTHDKPENVSRYIDEADFCEVILFTYNILNSTYKDVIAKAHDKGIGTIVMNPVGGGILVEDSPVLKQAYGTDAMIELAHRYLASDPNVDTVLCGINKPSDIADTLANFDKPPLTPQERQQIETIAASLSKDGMRFCTDCKYCMPCPQGLNIPGIMHAVYLDKLLQCPESARRHYPWVSSKENKTRASDCTACGACEAKCTQKLPIVEHMKFAAERLD